MTALDDVLLKGYRCCRVVVKKIKRRLRIPREAFAERREIAPPNSVPVLYVS